MAEAKKGDIMLGASPAEAYPPAALSLKGVYQFASIGEASGGAIACRITAAPDCARKRSAPLALERSRSPRSKRGASR